MLPMAFVTYFQQKILRASQKGGRSPTSYPVNLFSEVIAFAETLLAGVDMGVIPADCRRILRCAQSGTDQEDGNSDTRSDLHVN